MISKYTNLMLSILLCFCIVFNLSAMQTEENGEHSSPKNTSSKAQQLLCLILQANKTENKDYKLSETYFRMQSFIEKMKDKKWAKKKTLSSLRRLYMQTSKEFMQKDEVFTFLPKVVDGTSYTCVSSALLYSFILEELGYNYSIYLTKTHTFLKIHLENRDVLLESTDPYYGLIANKAIITKQMEAYKKESLASTISTNDSSFATGKEIALQELVGVHFYNLFLYHYQNRNFKHASNAFKRAATLYRESPEIKMFSKYFAKS